MHWARTTVDHNPDEATQQLRRLVQWMERHETKDDEMGEESQESDQFEEL